MKKRPGAALHSSWNWELISDKTLDWWLPRIRRIKEAFPDRVLIASIMAGSGNDKELQNWQRLARDCQDAGADGLELNFSCPHMDRRDMGSNIGKDQGLCSVVTEAVKEVAKVPVWCKLTPATAEIEVEAAACFRGGADAIVSSNTFPSHSADRSRDARVRDQRGRPGVERRPRRAGDSSALAGEDGPDDPGLPRQELLGNRRDLRLPQALSYFLLGCGTVQVCTAAMLDQAVGPNVIKRLLAGLDAFLERHAEDGWTSVEDFRGIRRDRIVSQSEIRRPTPPTTTRATRSSRGTRLRHQADGGSRTITASIRPYGSRVPRISRSDCPARTAPGPPASDAGLAKEQTDSLISPRRASAAGPWHTACAAPTPRLVPGEGLDQ